MPSFIDALVRLVQAAKCPPLDVQLFGRARPRAERMIDYMSSRSDLVGRDKGKAVALSVNTRLERALEGAEIIISQTRAGGMRSRHEDERLALRHGIPGDEGVGPSGLAAYLRGRPLTDKIATAWRKYAPDAAFLQLTNPLSLSLARTAHISGLRPIGLCELPLTTSQALVDAAAPSLGRLTHAHFGLNHQSWLYDFRDEAGRDRTSKVIEIAACKGLTPIVAERLHEEQAIPVSYLKLIYNSEREIESQRARLKSRGEELAEWAHCLEAAYLSPGGPATETVDDLLASRRMDWYELIVAPVIATIACNLTIEGVLNLPRRSDGVAVERWCKLVGADASPIEQAPLPKGPAQLLEQLIAYERLVLDLPNSPNGADIAGALAIHPMVSTANLARAMAADMLERLSICSEEICACS